MVITTHPGACNAVCAEDAAEESKNAATKQTKKHQVLRFSCRRETSTVELDFELVIVDTSTFVKLPRQLFFATRGMEDRLGSDRRCSRRPAFSLSFVISLELALKTPGCPLSRP